MKKTIKFFLVAIAATAMLFSACKKEDEDKNVEPDPTPVVINDDDLEKFDISNSQFGVTQTTTSSISVEWKQDEVKFDSVKIELKRLVAEVNEYGLGIGDTTFETIANALITNDTKYTFEGLETSQKFDILFRFYSNKKICKRSYKAISEDSDKMLVDGCFGIFEVTEIGGLKILVKNDFRCFYTIKNAYGEPLFAENDFSIIYTDVKDIAYGYHLITNKQFEELERIAGVSDEELANVKLDEPYRGNFREIFKFGDMLLHGQFLYLNDDGSIYARYYDWDGTVIRFKDIDNYPGSIDYPSEGRPLYVKEITK